MASEMHKTSCYCCLMLATEPPLMHGGLNLNIMTIKEMGGRDTTQKQQIYQNQTCNLSA